MNQRNFQRELENIIQKTTDGAERKKALCPPTLFLHSCCAPCSSYCLEYLCRFFAITVFYYNPNISMEAEYRKRVEEQKRLISAYNAEKKGYHISVEEGDYEPGTFFETVRGYETCPEGGERCLKCFDLRLRKTALRAKERGYDFFATTLTISPLKNAVWINEIGQALEEEFGIRWLPSDFKKKNGYKRSIELSEQYNLYRQNYCGCVFSLREREHENEA